MKSFACWLLLSDNTSLSHKKKGRQIGPQYTDCSLHPYFTCVWTNSDHPSGGRNTTNHHSIHGITPWPIPSITQPPTLLFVSKLASASFTDTSGTPIVRVPWSSPLPYNKHVAMLIYAPPIHTPGTHTYSYPIYVIPRSSEFHCWMGQGLRSQTGRCSVCQE